MGKSSQQSQAPFLRKKHGTSQCWQAKSPLPLLEHQSPAPRVPIRQDRQISEQQKRLDGELKARFASSWETWVKWGQLDEFRYFPSTHIWCLQINPWGCQSWLPLVKPFIKHVLKWCWAMPKRWCSTAVFCWGMTDDLPEELDADVQDFVSGC